MGEIEINAAHQSTGFAMPVEREIRLTSELQKIADEARSIYEKLIKHTL